MAKLYATLENSKGKTVSISDNNQITATVYDGNMKAYSVTIEWTTVGDFEHYQCQSCGHEQDGEGFTNEQPAKCEQCNKTKFTLVPAVMGAIVTSREYRNQPEELRKRKVKDTDENNTCMTCGKKSKFLTRDMKCEKCDNIVA